MKTSDFSTYYIETARHDIIFYEHYIYYIPKRSEENSESLKEKIINYVDTVKSGLPIKSVSIINSIANFPNSPDDIDWGKVSKTIIFSISYSEDNLKKGKYLIERIDSSFKKMEN